MTLIKTTSNAFMSEANITIGFDDLDVAPSVMYKHIKNQM